MYSKAARKYFERYAAKPIFERSIDETRAWDCAVVIPAWRESESLHHTIQSLQAAAQNAQKKVLMILVLNGTSDDLEARKKIEREFNPKLSSIHSLDTLSDLKIFQIERPNVGYARKVGMDFAARLFFEGCLRSPWLRTTDADALVDENYFVDFKLTDDYSSVLYEFIHTYDRLTLEAAQAHCLYDIFLRYYREGLDFAESPYDFYSLGSIIAVNVNAYIEVHGFSEREAGEDFYLLNKLAKVGKIQTLTNSVVTLEGRLSDRVPFGTGPEVKKILDKLRNKIDHRFYDPQVFFELKKWIDLLKIFAETRDFSIFEKPNSVAIEQFIERQNILAELKTLPMQSDSKSIRWRHLMNWFDGFRTLKFLHYIRDEFYPNIEWAEALRKAPFLQMEGPIDLKTVFEVGRQLEPARVLIKYERRHFS